MTDRTLPRWMSHCSVKGGDEQQTGVYKTNVLENYLPYLEFSGSVIYSQERNDCSFLSEDFRSSLPPGSAVGFDLEWPPSFIKGKTKKVAMVQLCASENKCYLFHLSSMSGFPLGLKMLLEDESIKKVGVGIEGDMWKLLSDFNVQLRAFVELGHLANEKLRCIEKWSLDGLVKHLFGKQLFKDRDVRCSQWDEFELTEEQKRYAATDAYAGLIIHQKLQSIAPGGSNAATHVKHKLSQMASEIEQIAVGIPEEVHCPERVETLVTDMSRTLEALKDLLMKTIEEDTNAIKDPSTLDADSRPSDIRYEKGVMSLDVSEYELQMLEMQTRQEELEEQSTLDFQATTENDLSLNSDLSYEVASDEDLENEMMQCVEEVERQNPEENVPHHGQHKEPLEQPATEEEDEVIEEEEEEFSDPTLPQPTPEEIKCLKMYFGHHGFKPVQWKVIYSVLKERRDNLVVMATGYGKSLCFQYPPVHCGKMSVVISPLIALMEDQVFQLQMSNIPACFLGSAQTNYIFDDLKKGHFRVVYMTPEFCSGNISLLELLNRTVGLSLIAIDEAHCISQWGHDFRNAYRNLGKLKKALPNVPIVALTATASPSIREDIVKSLILKNPLITCTSFDRPNLYLDVNRKSGDLLADFKNFLIKNTGGKYEFEGPVIVYCPSKKETERVTSALLKLSVRCSFYHAGLSIKQRRETQHKFMRDEIQCVVATVAFGMGINKPDIRKVIHYGSPKEMESYYQEIGRAGRDGLPSSCHVLWMPGDMVLNRFILTKTSSESLLGYKMEMMTKMEKYLNSSKCRRKLILSHFEDKQLRKVTSGIMGTDVCCDNCKSGLICGPSKMQPDQELQDFGACAFQLMSAIEALGESFGVTAPILFLRGSYSQKVPDRYRRHSLFGAGKGVQEVWWKALARALVLENYLRETTGQSKFITLCKLTNMGRMWLSKANNEKHRTLFLQPNPDLTSNFSVMIQSNISGPPNIRSPGSQCSAQSNTVRARTENRLPVKSSAVLPSTSTPKPQLPTVCPKELELQAELYGKLVAERQKLASKKDIPPAILATNKILLDMAKSRPYSVASLKQIEGVSEAKATMLEPLLQTISQFCKLHNLQPSEQKMKLSSSSSESSLPKNSTLAAISITPTQSLLPGSVSITYRLFQEERKNLKEVCDVRSLPLTVVESHLLQAANAKYQLDTERAGLTSAMRSKILHIITSPPINSDLSNLKSLRALVPEEISTFLLKLTVALVQNEGLPQGLSDSPSSTEPVWIQPQDKPVRKDCPVPKPGSPLASSFVSDHDEISMSDDELFSDMPMPEDPDVPPVTPTCSAMDLASWNQEQLDKDTQELFISSPEPNVSQPGKRRLPEWAHVPHGPASSFGSSKSNKRKKGLFK
ncbi:Werner syndrome ATP-dependent helicase homolog isoform X3 [Denticeps clupeoides]|uniref:DNA 3'-5' helicase n=2 Tax=Denticeps clupeoides TaxID=299321 RepID=A0AAY4E2I1_9TELE|nr:Werner syndrome ATP-dependent helicase isoform X3 [Denticeps clupeoides]XP_028827400.1 Werner syndrome ATP-dependent helicase isoform X3 [Denticeps clupeoides]XP_028827401.1 Werner syndrome ATP-dependent helicase isoform X3 [Denticeps clupeoides]